MLMDKELLIAERPTNQLIYRLKNCLGAQTIRLVPIWTGAIYESYEQSDWKFADAVIV